MPAAEKKAGVGSVSDKKRRLFGQQKVKRKTQGRKSDNELTRRLRKITTVEFFAET